MHRNIKFEYGYEGLNTIIKKVYSLQALTTIFRCWHFKTYPIRYIRQFTGAKDKYNIDIFEGDILQHSNPFDNPVVVNWNKEYCGYVLNVGDTSYSVGDKNLIIIGNIYENPELINYNYKN